MAVDGEAMALFLFLLVAFYRNLLEQLNSAGDAMAKGYCCVFIACVGSTEEVVGDDWQEHIVHDFTRRRARTPAGRGHWYGSLGIRAGKKPSCTLLFYPLFAGTAGWILEVCLLIKIF